MPRYYFHLHNDIDAPDSEGAELPDLAAARERAVKYAVDMTAASVLEHRQIDLHHRIDVADDTGGILCTVHFGDVVKVLG